MKLLPHYLLSLLFAAALFPLFLLAHTVPLLSFLLKTLGGLIYLASGAELLVRGILGLAVRKEAPE